jgi:putative transposase
LRQAEIVPSMSRAGCPWDNAMAESFMAMLKREEVDGRAYRDLIDARSQIGTFLEQVYNRHRLHSALGYRPPEAFEAELPRLHGLPHAASHAAVVDGVCA